MVARFDIHGNVESDDGSSVSGVYGDDNNISNDLRAPRLSSSPPPSVPSVFSSVDTILSLPPPYNSTTSIPSVSVPPHLIDKKVLNLAHQQLDDSERRFQILQRALVNIM